MSSIQFFMSSFFSRMEKDSKGTPTENNSFWTQQAKKYLRRIIWIVIGLVLFVILFNLCNWIPNKTVNVDIDGYGITRSNIDMDLSLGKGTRIRERFDSTFRKAFGNSGKDGVAISINAHGIAGDCMLFENVAKNRNTIANRFRGSTQLDSLNGAIRVRFHNEESHKWKPWFSSHHKKADVLSLQDDRQQVYFTRSSERAKRTFTTETYVLFKDSVSVMADQRVFDKGTHAWSNQSIWSLCDISQAYVGIHLSDNMHRKHPDGNAYNSPFDPEYQAITLSIDFGSPVSFSEMTPMPDEITMTGMLFKDQKKIQEIISNGIVFHAKLIHNENLQGVKMFWITTVIAALITLLAKQIYKLVRHLIHYRNLKKRRLNSK